MNLVVAALLILSHTLPHRGQFNLDPPFLPSPPEVGGGVGPPPSGLLLARTGVKAENDLEDISTRKKLSFLADKTAPPFLLVTI